jgi:glutathione S-transferase
MYERNPALTLPYLIDGEKIITESDAIAIYICFKGNKPELLGRDVDEQVQLATVHGVYKDFHPNYIKLVYSTYDENNTF